MTMVNPNVYPADHAVSDAEVDTQGVVHSLDNVEGAGGTALGEATATNAAGVRKHGKKAVEAAFLAAGLCDERRLRGVGYVA